MIRIERDPEFWVGVASHPALTHALMGMAPSALAPLVVNPKITPIAAEHGGFLLTKLDAFGFIYEFHVLFTPEGWGREVARAGRHAVRAMFAETSCRMLLTYQLANNIQSQPPLSFGFKPLGDWASSVLGPVKPWALTHDAWLVSPVARKGMN